MSEYELHFTPHVPMSSWWLRGRDHAFGQKLAEHVEAELA